MTTSFQLKAGGGRILARDNGMAAACLRGHNWSVGPEGLKEGSQGRPRRVAAPGLPVMEATGALAGRHEDPGTVLYGALNGRVINRNKYVYGARCRKILSEKQDSDG